MRYLALIRIIKRNLIVQDYLRFIAVASYLTYLANGGF